MSGVVLDASALLALLNGEPGAAGVAEALIEARMCAVNLAEVASHYVHVGMPVADVHAMLHPLPIEIVAADESLALAAGGLRAVTASAGLSLGDRFCLALAKRDDLPAMTADRQWRVIAEVAEVDVVVIR